MSSRGKTPSAPVAAASAVPSSSSVVGKALPKYVGGKRPMSEHELLQRRRLSKGSARGITKPSLKRLARRAGVKHITANVIENLHTLLRFFGKKILRDAKLYTAHSKRHTISCLDLVTALKRHGRSIYGFGSSR